MNIKQTIKTKTTYIILVIIVGVCSFSLISLNKKTEIVQTSTAIGLSSKKIGWGIKRASNNMQPDFGSENKLLIDKNNGIAMGNDIDKCIYLTFDEGYEAGYTSKILDVLKENNVKATFFITAHYLNTASELVQRMIEEGHIIGNHTVNHKSMPSISDEEIEKEIMQLHQTIYEKFNYEMKFIRPPKGEFNERTLKKTYELGYKTVMWSFAYMDWDEKKQPSIENAQKIIIDNFHNGEIMLLHPNSKTNSEVLDTIIKEAKKQGYVFKTLEEFK